ncbi:MAG: alanine racemase [Verrucomicrobia bacterium]|nr:alanine racemase [Verrucomicrobiota bacterium]MDA1087516.1 alanine racemase [Verrucomicrobiota bacterium]
MATSTLGKSGFSRHGSWVEVDLEAFAQNVRSIRASLQDRADLIVVVKSDAYGHGLSRIAARAASEGVSRFAVATPDEAMAVRRAAPEGLILLLGVAVREDVAALIEHKIVPVIVSEAHGQALAAAARELDEALEAHLKFDTGMARLGIPWEQGVDVMARLLEVRGLSVTGLCSHFATVEADHSGTGDIQFARFSQIARRAPPGLFKHLSSSRAFLCSPEWDSDGVRVGIAAYGYGAMDPRFRVQTHPILQWKCRVIQVKSIAADVPVGYYGTHVTQAPTNIAVLGSGYADGYLRTLSDRGDVLIRGRRCRVIGRVSMNWITVDAGPDGDISEGDEAVLIGRQGDETIWADELAKLCRTIPYEILTSIRPTIERRYVV